VKAKSIKLKAGKQKKPAMPETLSNNNFGANLL